MQYLRKSVDSVYWDMGKPATGRKLIVYVHFIFVSNAEKFRFFLLQKDPELIDS